MHRRSAGRSAGCVHHLVDVYVDVDVETYRQMLVNHEVGHLLGQKHPRPLAPPPDR